MTIPIASTSAAGLEAERWQQRHDELERGCNLDDIVSAREEALRAASTIQQLDDNAANAYAANEASERLVNVDTDEEALGRKVDIALAILWSAPTKGKARGRRPFIDHNFVRSRALPALQQLASAALSESSRDLVPLRCLESSREGTVELVRCTFDRQIYILKSTTKGAAKRNYRTNAPMTERRLLSLARQARKGKDAFTPSCVAAFQSPGSLHVLMEYCPAGDLYHFLESAGQAPVTNEARSKSGGLLCEEYVRKYAVDMVAGISWLHDKGFLHRDLKPGNWLFDRSGHLLLCDLASAAPFAQFDEVPASASLPQADGFRSLRLRQRRILYRHCCLIGTADYIAPEVFWAADLMSRRRMRRDKNLGTAESPSINDRSDDDDSADGEDDDEPPPDGPGLYGPECDWWSLGVIIFEMIYKRMPFFSDSIAETMEMIKEHAEHLSFDSWVQCSPNLKDLMSQLIAPAEDRLGCETSAQVQRHPFFRGMDWSKPWRDPPPFVPNLDTTDLSYDGDPEPSILHSPGLEQDSRSFQARSFAASRLWDDDGEDFPAFPNSVELSRAAFADELQGAAAEEGGESEKTITLLDAQTSCDETLAQIEKLWSKFDPTWIGFTRVPARNAFDSGQPKSGEMTLDEIPNSAAPAKTPYGKRPAEADIFRGSLHRHVLETASKKRAQYGDHFKTPLRKTSHSSMMQSTGAPTPASPYPFPVAPHAVPKTTPAHPSVLRHKDLERARRSVSTSTGEGSDSRCSGGSNAKREISEREAWQELKLAVMQSARKTQQKEDRFRTNFRDSMLAGSASDEDDNDGRNAQDTWLPDTSKKVSFELRSGRASPNDEKRRHRHSLLQGNMLRQALAPHLDTTSPNEAHSVASSASSPASPMPPARDQEDEPLEPSEGLAPRQALTKRKSARQLLLSAQHRETPTRTARPSSPLDGGDDLGFDAHSPVIRTERHTMPAGPHQSSPGFDRSAIFQQFFHDGQRESTPAALRPPRASLPSLQLARHNVVSNLKRQGTLQRRDSRETLSQYRLGINPDDFVDLKENANRPGAQGKRILSRQASSARIDAMRSSSSLSLLRENSLSSPSLPSLPDAFLGPGPLSSSESNASSSDLQAQAPRSFDVSTRAPRMRRPLRTWDNSKPREAPPLKGQATTQEKFRRPLVPRVNEPLGHSESRQNAIKDASPPKAAPTRPSLFKRASSYLKGLGSDARREAGSASNSPSPKLKTLSVAGDRRGSAASDVQSRAHSPLRPRLAARLSAKSPSPSTGSSTLRASPSAAADTSLTVHRLHARYDYLQSEIQDLERRLRTVRSNLGSPTASTG